MKWTIFVCLLGSIIGDSNLIAQEFHWEKKSIQVKMGFPRQSSFSVGEEIELAYTIINNTSTPVSITQDTGACACPTAAMPNLGILEPKDSREGKIRMRAKEGIQKYEGTFLIAGIDESTELELQCPISFTYEVFNPYKLRIQNINENHETGIPSYQVELWRLDDKSIPEGVFLMPHRGYSTEVAYQSADLAIWTIKPTDVQPGRWITPLIRGIKVLLSDGTILAKQSPEKPGLSNLGTLKKKGLFPEYEFDAPALPEEQAELIGVHVVGVTNGSIKSFDQEKFLFLRTKASKSPNASECVFRFTWRNTQGKLLISEELFWAP